MKQSDLFDLAFRLENDEKLRLRYNWPVGTSDGRLLYEERVDPLLDVAEDTGILFVSHDGDIIKIWANEAIEVLPGTG